MKLLSFSTPSSAQEMRALVVATIAAVASATVADWFLFTAKVAARGADEWLAVATSMPVTKVLLVTVSLIIVAAISRRLRDSGRARSGLVVPVLVLMTGLALFFADIFDARRSGPVDARHLAALAPPEAVFKSLALAIAVPIVAWAASIPTLTAPSKASVEPE